MTQKIQSLPELMKVNEEKSRERFGRFYASQYDDTNEPKTVDIEGGIKVICEEDGRTLRVVASDDIEKFLRQSQESIVEWIRAWAKGNQFVDPNQAGQFALHADGYNEALEDLLQELTREAEK